MQGAPVLAMSSWYAVFVGCQTEVKGRTHSCPALEAHPSSSLRGTVPCIEHCQSVGDIHERVQDEGSLDQYLVWTISQPRNHPVRGGRGRFESAIPNGHPMVAGHLKLLVLTELVWAWRG